MSLATVFLLLIGLSLAALAAGRGLRWLVADDRERDGDTLIQCVVCHDYKPKRDLVPYTDAFQRAAFRCADHCRHPRRVA
jgi:hypothetical protein